MQQQQQQEQHRRQQQLLLQLLQVLQLLYGGLYFLDDIYRVGRRLVTVEVIEKIGYFTPSV